MERESTLEVISAQVRAGEANSSMNPEGLMFSIPTLGIAQSAHHNLRAQHKFLDCQVGYPNKTSQCAPGDFLVIGHRKRGRMVFLD